MSNWDWVTTEMFEEKYEELKNDTRFNPLIVDGVDELCREFLNNEVLEALAAENDRNSDGTLIDGEDDGSNEEPCLRKMDESSWWCINDHTGCLWNDGNNTCSHPGQSPHPLE